MKPPAPASFGRILLTFKLPIRSTWAARPRNAASSPPPSSMRYRWFRQLLHSCPRIGLFSCFLCVSAKSTRLTAEFRMNSAAIICNPIPRPNTFLSKDRYLQRNAVFNRRISPFVHLTICSPPNQMVIANHTAPPRKRSTSTATKPLQNPSIQSAMEALSE